MSKYKYVDLKSATGSVNVIAIAKYAGKPKKTKGSGYSLFLSITDPSLNGDKMSCIVFHDSEENLPQIQSPGDIIIMHRLVVKQYNGRNQGCGYGTTGFSAAVFSGVHSDPLIPFKSNTRCSFGDEELKVVEYLKQWYVSPNCPVERENLRNSPEQGSNEVNRNCGSGIKLLGLLKEQGFCTIEGQIISIYKSVEMDNSVVIYIWDGSFSNNERDIVFTGLPQNRLCQLLPYSQHDPHLTALTGHNLQQWNESILKDSKTYTEENLHKVLEPNFASTFLETFREDKNCHEMFTDWSVPIYIYDEHTINEPVISLKPGDLIRIHNVHVSYGRLTISQISNIPLIINKRDRELNDWNLLYPIQTEIIPPIPPNSWLAVTNLPPSASNLNVVYTRLCARVIEVAPLNVSMLKDSLLLTCSNCLTLFRASCISDNDDGLCDCGSRLAILPFIFLQLEDPTGKLILTVSGRNVIDLISNLVEDDLKSCINNDAWWTGLIFEMKELQNIDISPAKMFLEQCVRLLGQWIDVAVKISWPKESVPGITNITDNNDLQYNFIDWDSL
ncbi:Protection of telomeres protein [Schistosoma japonicum]|nr:Protection of telomeres protein [Schistosoma japonicum]